MRDVRAVGRESERVPSRSKVVSWNTPSDVDLAGWIVYRGTASGVYTTGTDVGLTTSTGAPQLTRTGVAAGLLNGKNYFYALTAYDYSGNESTFSAEGQTGTISFQVTNLQRTFK